ncbi:ImmA/IrrE family metallo-endopeptidase [Leuconostoc mesenteroides]|uniref:ImmA/IrrE family metallo-endopeptidase n=1 Tax=Leuconostoc mesenteroides TaxID=1245 RepID=UPI001CC1036E|nr:ImmA/IrrE family metallo-endopeptidase [Leuconostoc mesenteroides]MBZ1510954.1 ImmA/IrrE family metallo-endopeptidase [Leuconostoc mesenteroides]
MYQDLYEANDKAIQDVSEVLNDKIAELKITVVRIPSDISNADMSNIKKRVIILNLNFETTFSITFRIAHEMSHILYGSSSKTYTFSPLSKKTEEIEANLHGIQILADIFFGDYYSTTQRWEYRYRFIELFDLQPITHLVEKCL